MGANFRILGILFVHAMDVCSGLEISLLKEAFKQSIIHSVNFPVACTTKIYRFRSENLHAYLNINHCFLELQIIS